MITFYISSIHKQAFNISFRGAVHAPVVPLTIAMNKQWGHRSSARCLRRSDVSCLAESKFCHSVSQQQNSTTVFLISELCKLLSVSSRFLFFTLEESSNLKETKSKHSDLYFRKALQHFQLDVLFSKFLFCLGVCRTICL